MFEPKSERHTYHEGKMILVRAENDYKKTIIMGRHLAEVTEVLQILTRRVRWMSAQAHHG